MINVKELTTNVVLQNADSYSQRYDLCVNTKFIIIH